MNQVTVLFQTGGLGVPATGYSDGEAKFTKCYL